MPGFEGLRVLSLESRNAAQMAKLIESHGGAAISAPSMRELPVQENPSALQFAADLFDGKFEIVIFLTGVGTRILFGAVESRYPREKLVEALSRATIVARGPKPAAVLREFLIPIAVLVPEPNTWRDLLKALDERHQTIPLAGTRIAIQEYGVSNRELVAELEQRGAIVTPVPVYQWALPEDTGPLRRAVSDIAEGKIDVLLVTSATQVDHLMLVAVEMGVGEKTRHGLQRAVVASVGPIATEALRRHRIGVDLEPGHPKMGQLVYETAAQARFILRLKRGSQGPT